MSLIMRYGSTLVGGSGTDGKAVLHTSDLTASSSTYLVEVREFDALPESE
jgi:hypothetical protein